MARKRKLTKAEMEALTAAVVFLLRGYLSPIARRTGSLWIILGFYALCLALFCLFAAAGFPTLPIIAIAAVSALGFAFYHRQKEQEAFQRQYQAYHRQFAPAYDARYALPAGRNKIYAYKIAGRDNVIKLGQTRQQTAERIHSQLKTANIEPHILWEIYAEGQSGCAFDDYGLHRFLVRNGYGQVKAATGRKTEWFHISDADLHKEVYRFYLMH